ncbi:endonuclease exonuclease phosphatase family protein [Babesia ovis]|uniref:Endonuclease exonuclease phosphatase family protein n=1 Tax=Babesia ovis TaxID=5869 RepID=A0A9W5TAA5_BABOV|nr:endonuclease exonuclease phosphatase family protein [Babesia ovis]
MTSTTPTTFFSGHTSAFRRSNNGIHKVLGWIFAIAALFSLVNAHSFGLAPRFKRKMPGDPHSYPTDSNGKRVPPVVIRSLATQLCNAVGCKNIEADIPNVEKLLIPLLRQLSDPTSMKEALKQQNPPPGALANVKNFIRNPLRSKEKPGPAERPLTPEEQEFVEALVRGASKKPVIPVFKGNLNIWCGTWNMGGSDLGPNDDVREWISSGVQSNAGIYVFFLQEFVPLNTTNVLTSRQKAAKDVRFNQAIMNIFNSHPSTRSMRFVHLKSNSMVGLHMTIFLSEQLKTTVENLAISSVKTGFNGNVGNKGGVGIRFSVAGHNMSFVDVHLNSGVLPAGTRINELNTIVNKIFPAGSSRSMLEDDLFVVAGDFNFHITSLDNRPTTEALKLIHDKNFGPLLQSDEFLTEKRSPRTVLKPLLEAPITFKPTYKFGKGTNFHDARRSPAWCDRVLYGGKASPGPQDRVHLTQYRGHPRMMSSDHKAVSALIKIEGNGTPKTA